VNTTSEPLPLKCRGRSFGQIDKCGDLIPGSIESESTPARIILEEPGFLSVLASGSHHEEAEAGGRVC
jgi:hypothetical protein